MSSQQPPALDEELEAQLEERADYIPLDRLESETAVTDFYVSAVSTDGTDLRL